MPDPDPFVLLDNARPGSDAPVRLYRNPVECSAATDADGLADLLDTVAQAKQRGLHAAGYLAYEAGHSLEPRLATRFGGNSGQRLGWFGLFENYEEIAPADMPGWLAQAHPGQVELPRLLPAIKCTEYLRRFAEVQEAIAAGDIYQANLTFPMLGRFDGDPMALYSAIRPRAASGYGSALFDGEDWILSFSPELFFTLRDGSITVRPMKGTSRRKTEAEADRAALEALRASAKDRSENLMITDLMRNDLSRVARSGSVEVTGLYDIESYPSVHQMTSTVRATLRGGADAVDLIRTIFPCGSITGAPKIRAMEILDALETSPRGPYCGAMGRIDTNGDAAFNVAIRTLHLTSDPRTPLNRAAKLVAMGLGSAVVADSDGQDEWHECHAKGAFLQGFAQPFDLIETMGFDPAAGIVRLEAHLARMKDSAATLGFEFDRHATRNALQAACFHADTPARIRLLLSSGGATAIEIAGIPQSKAGTAKVVVRTLPIATDDPRLSHKTTDRAFYDTARAAAQAEAGADEVVFTDSAGHLTEGSFTHVYVERDGMLLTPPLVRGLLPGVLRSELLDEGKAREADLQVADLADGFLLGNSLRGLLRARLIDA